MVTCYTGVAISCIAAACIPETSDLNKKLVIAAAISARLCLVGTLSFSVTALVTLYPTNIRNNGVNLVSGVARLAGVLVPQLLLVSKVRICVQVQSRKKSCS